MNGFLRVEQGALQKVKPDEANARRAKAKKSKWKSGRSTYIYLSDSDGQYWKVSKAKVTIIFRDAYCWQGFTLKKFFRQFDLSSIARIEIAFPHIVDLRMSVHDKNYQGFSASDIAFHCGPVRNLKVGP